MARSAPKLQKISPVLINTINLTVESAISSIPIDGARRRELATHCVAAAEAFLYGKVCNARIVVYGQTPMVRLTIKHKDETCCGTGMWTIGQTDPFTSMINSFNLITGTHWPTDIAKEVLPLLPPDQVAMQMADIVNASAAVLLDPKKTAKARERMRILRAGDKERLMAAIRRAFADHDNMISESEIIQMWRETLVCEVQDS